MIVQYNMLYPAHHPISQSENDEQDILMNVKPGNYYLLLKQSFR